MDLTKKQIIWGILLFGTLIGFNESVIGNLDLQNKSVILSTITLLLFTMARFYIPRVGTSLLIMAVAVLFKLTDLGILFCKPASLIMLGSGFEFFAFFFLRKKEFSSRQIVLTSVLTVISSFTLFALVQLFLFKNEAWAGAKFNSYVFFKAPLTAVASSLFSVSAVWVMKRFHVSFIQSLYKKPVLSQLILGVFIAVLWIVG